MLTYNLSERNGLPIYEYIYRMIKTDIQAGRIAPGERLPSKRTLSQHLKISVITVQNAYALLEDEGYIYTAEKRGYFVSAIVRAGTVPLSLPLEKRQIESTDTDDVFLDLVNNRANGSDFPFSVWSKLMRLVLSEGGKKLLSASPNGGVAELRQAIAGYLYSFRGMNVSPQQIIVGAGTEYLYNLIIQLLGRDKIYATENPGYLKTAMIYSANGVSQRFIDIDKAGADISKLSKSDADILHISPSHHYPTGIVTPITRRLELLGWASEKPSRFIIEDDYDSEFRFSARPIDTLFSIDNTGSVIYVNTFSKTLCPSIRISYMVLPQALLEQFKCKLGFYACTVPVFEQFTLARFIKSGYFEKHISRMKNRYRTVRDACIDTISTASFAPKVRIREEQSGLHFLLDIDTAMSDGEIKRKALQVGIRVSFLSDYLHKPDEKFAHKAVINYSAVDKDKLCEAGKRISEVFG